MKYFYIYLIIINLCSLLMMGSDKDRARRGASRIPEKTLFASAAMGGSLGAIAGMRLFRHKTKHRSFTIGMPCILAVQLAAAYFIFS